MLIILDGHCQPSRATEMDHIAQQTKNHRKGDFLVKIKKQFRGVKLQENRKAIFCFYPLSS